MAFENINDMSPIHIEPKSLKNILAKWAREPYPSVISPWKVVVVPAVIIFLVLYLLQPFGIARIGSGKLWVTLGSGCISAGVSSLFVWVLPWMFPRYYEERAWTLGKEVLSTLALLLCITVCVWFYVAWLCGVMPGVRLFFTVLLWVLILGAFPTVLFAMWNRNIRLARNLREATELNLRLSKKQEAEDNVYVNATLCRRNEFGRVDGHPVLASADHFFYVGVYVTLGRKVAYDVSNF